MIKNLIKPLVKSIAKGVLAGGGLLPKTRFLVYLEQALGSKYELATAKTLNGDFEIEMNIVKNGLTTAIFGGSNTTRSFVQSNDNVELATADGTALWIDGVVNIPVGNMVSIKFVRVSGVIECFIAGQSKGTRALSGNVGIQYVGANQTGGATYERIISDLVINDNGVSESYSLGQEAANTEESKQGGNFINYTSVPVANREEYKLIGGQYVNISPDPQALPPTIDISSGLSGELIQTQDYSDTSFWDGAYEEQLSGVGFFVTTGGGQGPRTYPNVTITNGNTYVVSVSNLEAGGSINWRTVQSGVNAVLTADGEATFTIPQGDTGCQLYIRAGSAGTHTATVSLKQVIV